jgi:predicted transposase YdaD
LPVQKESTLTPRCQQLLEQRPDWIELILPILSERFPGLTTAEIMTTFANFRDFWRHTPAFQDILQEGREEGRQEGRNEGLAEGRRREACALAGRQLERRFGRLSPAITSRIEALSLPKLEEFSLALLDFQSAEELEEWLDRQEQG